MKASRITAVGLVAGAALWIASGHLMPRYYLLAAKINPDTDMKRVAFSGAHDATAAAVAGGKVDPDLPFGCADAIDVWRS